MPAITLFQQRRTGFTLQGRNRSAKQFDRAIRRDEPATCCLRNSHLLARFWICRRS